MAAPFSLPVLTVTISYSNSIPTVWKPQRTLSQPCYLPSFRRLTQSLLLVFSIRLCFRHQFHPLYTCSWIQTLNKTQPSNVQLFAPKIAKLQRSSTYLSLTPNSLKWYKKTFNEWNKLFETVFSDPVAHKNSSQTFLFFFFFKLNGRIIFFSIQWGKLYATLKISSAVSPFAI